MDPIRNKKAALLTLAQMHLAIVGSSRTNNPVQSAEAAVSCLASIIALNEALVPSDVETACKNLMRFVDGQHDEENNPYPQPPWFTPGLYDWEKPVKVDNE